MLGKIFRRILVKIITAILVVGGILIWQYFGSPKEEVKDGIANWQTYQNEEYGFEIEYPLEWEVKNYKNNYSFLSPKVEECKKTQYECDIYSPGIAIYKSLIELPNNSKNLSFDKWLDKQIGLNLVSGRSNILVGNYDGVEVKDSGVAGGYRNIYIIKDSGVIIKFSIADESSEMTTFNQMLSTFKFLVE